MSAVTVSPSFILRARKRAVMEASWKADRSSRSTDRPSGVARYRSSRYVAAAPFSRANLQWSRTE